MARKSKTEVEADSEAGDYDNILNRQWGDIPEVVLIPSGSWVLKGKNAAYKAPSGESNGRVLFFLVPKEPMDDVPQSALDALGDDYDYSSNQIVKTVWIESNRDWKTVEKILTAMNVDMSGTIQQTLKRVKGAEVVAFVDQREFVSRGETKQENTAENFTALS